MVLRLREVEDLILYDLYWFVAEPSGPEDIEPDTLFQLLEGHDVSWRFFEAASDSLVEKQYVDRIGALPQTLGITNRGISYVDSLLDDPNSFIWELHERRSIHGAPTIPAAGRYVELDHNSQEYQDAVNAGTELIDAVRKSNAYPEADDLDRERRLAELEAGYRLLNAVRVNPSTVKGVLGGVLTYLAMKFADEPIGELAINAWKSIKILLSLE